MTQSSECRVPVVEPSLLPSAVTDLAVVFAFMNMLLRKPGLAIQNPPAEGKPVS